MATATPVDVDVDVHSTNPDDATPAASTAARYLLAALSLGAGAIHMAMVPSHSGESLAEGIGFAASGWFQVIFAGALLAKPSKLWLKLGIVLNLAFIAVWAVSRTRGLPFGAHANLTEAATAIDMLCVGLEAGLVVFAGVVLSYPRFLADLSRATMAVGSIIPVAALIAATAAIASPSASGHSQSGHAGHGNEVATGSAGADHHGTGAMDHGAMDHSNGAMDHTNMDHGNGAMDHSNGAMDHGHAASVSVKPEDRCDWDMNTQAYWSKNPPAKEDPSHLGSHAEHAEGSATAGAGSGEGNEHGAQAWNPLTDKAQCDELRKQIARMEEVAKKYPTAQDAVDAGCIRLTIYVTGIAAHYGCFRNGWDAKADLEKPEMLLYGGSQMWAPIVGLSYMIYTPDNPMLDPTEELWVRTMPFHYHSGLCMKGALVIGGDNSDPAKCEAAGGKVMGKTGYMGHYWMPECNSPDGVFSAANPRLDLDVANLNDDPKYDPAKGGDPTVLQQNPCQGSNMGGGLDDTFGAPEGVLPEGTEGPSQQAAGSGAN